MTNVPSKKVNTDVYKTLDYFKLELENFEGIAACLKPCPGEIPELDGIDIYGETMPFNGVAGGDHIIYLDFNNRCDLDLRIAEAKKANLPGVVEKLKLNKRRGGILLADAAGHNITDALLAAMFHQAFLTGVQYELGVNGEVTPDLFEILNTRFFNSSSLSRFITLIYGEISDTGTFRFISAGHPLPVVFSNRYAGFIPVCSRQKYRCPPIGTFPSKADINSHHNVNLLGCKKKYIACQIDLTIKGDILLLYSDGLSKHHINDMETLYFPHRLESTLRRIKNGSAKEIYFSLKEDLLNFAPPGDDISFVVIKKI